MNVISSRLDIKYLKNGLHAIKICQSFNTL